jgi:alkaline phosphatase
MKINIFLIIALAALSLGAKPKYVFLFIGDGMSVPQRMVAEEFAKKIGYGDFAMNSLPYQASTRTQSANSVITDSAAAATAIACGEKTDNGTLGKSSDGRVLKSVAEVAKESGMKVGIITTVTITHATPAAFYAHRDSRGDDYGITLDLINSGFDHFAGGAICRTDKNHPEDKGDTYKLAEKAGYVITENIQSWKALKSGTKSISIFSRHALPFHIDNDGEYPRLYEMLEKTIELIDGDDGFFIMCEGGRIDYAGHANDAATNLRDVLELDRAVKSALSFMAKHPDETLIIVTGDHETGGMSMGFAGIGGKFRVEHLKGQNISVEEYSEKIKKTISKRGAEITFEEIEKGIKEYFGLEKLTKKERAQLEEAFNVDVGFVKANVKDTTAHNVSRRYVFAQAVKNVLNSRAGIGWSSAAHTALPTFTTAIGNGADILVGMLDNTDIGKRLSALLKKSAK